MLKRNLFRLMTLLITCLLLLGSMQPALSAPNQTTRVSVASDGEQGNNDSRNPAISADGRFVAFRSRATNLVEGDTNDAYDIFVHDRQTRETTRVSVDSDGGQGNGDSHNPAISADGRFVAFESFATNLVTEDTNSRADIFVHDRETKITTRVSVGPSLVEGNGDSYSPAISADGRFVAFESFATNLVTEDTNSRADIFVHDRETKITTRVSVGPSLVEGNGGSFGPAVSADGRFVAFYSYANNLVAGDTNDTSDVFIHDRETGETTRVSVDSDDEQGNSDSLLPAISGDGRFVAFESWATNLVAVDTNESFDIFVHDRQTGETTRVSVDSDDEQGNDDSYSPAISADGRFVAFYSFANNLVAEDTNGYRDIFVHNRLTGETIRASVASDGTQGNGVSRNPAISGNGDYVAFRSEATNLVPNDTNGTWDIFVRSYLWANFLPLVIR